MNVKVAIFDDNAQFLEAMSILVTGLAGLELTGAYRNTDDLTDHLKINTPDIVLMDIGIPPVDGIKATKEIVEHFPGVKVIIQTIFEDDDKVFAAICAGASGYVLKSCLPRDLSSSISEVMAGGSPISSFIASKILDLFRDHFHKTSLVKDYNLSRREKEILGYLVAGCSYKLAADRCGIALETVKSHIARIYEKLHVNSMSGAVAKAIRENLT